VLIDLTDRVVLITGAGRGIGAGLALRYAQEGARIALLDRSSQDLEETGAAVSQAGTEWMAVPCDIRDPTAVRAAVDSVAGRFGRLDVLVNNAGIAPESRVEPHSPELWDDVFATNTRGSFLCVQAAIPHMKKQRWGRILNAASFAAVIPSIGYAAYAASKAAVVSMTRVMAAELGPWEITVNAYAPGMIPTQMNNLDRLDDANQTRLLNTLSIRRWGNADDIASLLIFLSSDQAAYITGTMIDTSGGKYAVQFPHFAHQEIK